jgi:hypothetical protein
MSHTDFEYDSMVRERDRFAAELAGCKQQLALAPTYQKMIDHHGRQEERIAQLEAQLRILIDEIAVRGIPIRLSDASAALASFAAETPPRRAHSKSEHKRLSALGVECAPPEMMTHCPHRNSAPPFGECKDCRIDALVARTAQLEAALRDIADTHVSVTEAHPEWRLSVIEKCRIALAGSSAEMKGGNRCRVCGKADCPRDHGP